MKPLASLAVALLLVAPAFADEPTPPAPAPTPGEAKPTAVEPPKARKVDPAAAKALERYVNSVHLPASSGMKSLQGKGDFAEGPIKLGIHPKWDPEKGFDFDLEIDDAVRSQIAAQGVPEDSVNDVVRGQLGQLVGFAGINSVFEAPGRNWEHYDIVVKQDGDDEVVTLTPFDGKADADSRRYVFGKDGLLKAVSVDPKADPSNPQIQMLKDMGIVFESTLTYTKQGDRSLLTGRSLMVGPQEITTKFSYFGGDKGPWLLKDAVITLPQGDQTIHFHDYTVDGKAAEGTAKTAEPATPPTPAPPAPTPPAPKDEPK